MTAIENSYTMPFGVCRKWGIVAYAEIYAIAGIEMLGEIIKEKNLNMKSVHRQENLKLPNKK